MKRLTIALALFVGTPLGFGQGTAFTYQGRLHTGNNPAHGNYDFRFTIWNAESGPSLVSGTLGTNALAVSNGLFTVTLDFGPGVFTGAERWLEISVRTNGGGSFDTLGPRQRLTSTPYAITAGNIGSGGLAGVYSNAVTFSNSVNSFSGTFTGNGGALTNLNAATLGGIGSNGFWRTSGNVGTIPGVNFIGTTDNQPLEIQVNGTRALRIEPHATSAPSLAGGYHQNSVAGYHGAVVSGGGTSGSPNYALGNYAFVGAGHGGQAAHYSAVVAGAYNVSPGLFSFIGSGEANTNLPNYSFIGGGELNVIQSESVHSTISGGRLNTILRSATNSTISGGWNNLIQSNAASATIGGGIGNAIFNNAIFGVGYAGTISGGAENIVNATYGAVGGGRGNAVFANWGTIAGGRDNQSTRDYATVGGGRNNFSLGVGSTVPGGRNNSASGTDSFAAGNRAKANHNGSFVWADSQAADFGSTMSDQFAVRAAGGTFFDSLIGIGTSSPGVQLDVLAAQGTGRFTATNNVNGAVLVLRNISPSFNYLGAINFENNGGTPGQIGYLANDTMIFRAGGVQRVALDGGGNLSFGAQTRQMLNLWGTQYGIGIQASTMYFRIDNFTPDGGFAWYRGGTHNDGQFNSGGGSELMRLNPLGLWVNGAFLGASDRNIKAGFESVDPKAVLEKVAALPITRWHYTNDSATTHLGPVAQDFHAAFGVGANDKTIATVDAEGVALAAIQGLNQKLEEQGADLKIRGAEVESLRAEVAELKHLVNRLLRQQGAE